MSPNEILNMIQENALALAMVIVGGLIIVVSIVSIIISIVLAISYIKYNKDPNRANITGEQAARRILDSYELNNIKVKTSGSLLMGNSYSHYFKKVRLRRRTMKKSSVASLAMAAQKSSLAVLDKEGDSDMKLRVKLTPIMTFGPLAFIPLIIIGVALDYVINQNIGSLSIIGAAVGLLFYIASFVMSLMVLKTEKKAQAKAVEILEEKGMASEFELKEMQKLFKLYNIEYVNNLILSMLETLYYILRIVAILQGKSNPSSSSRK